MDFDPSISYIVRNMPIEYVKTQGYCSAKRCNECIHFCPDHRLCTAVRLSIKLPAFEQTLPDEECFDELGLPRPVYISHEEADKFFNSPNFKNYEKT